MQKGLLVKRYVDAILYINLDHRKDRKEQIVKEIAKLDFPKSKIHPIKGYPDLFNGARGCARSHIHALQLAMINGWKNVLILEDDCIFIKDSSEINRAVSSFFETMHNRWNVFFLGGRMKIYLDTKWDHIKDVRWGGQAHAYIVNEHYYPLLIQSFLKSFILMFKDNNYVQSMEKAIDQQWVFLQMLGGWYANSEILAVQRHSYSDIELKEKQPASFFQNKIDQKKIDQLLTSLLKDGWTSMLQL